MIEALAAVALTVSPAHALVDTPVDVRIAGLAPRERVVLTATADDARARVRGRRHAACEA